jgi:hypothetical protein
MIIIFILVALVSLLCPFLIFLDYHKRKNVHLAIIYVIAFFGIIFLLSKIIYHYGMVLALAAPILILALCLLQKKCNN